MIVHPRVGRCGVQPRLVAGHPDRVGDESADGDEAEQQGQVCTEVLSQIALLRGWLSCRTIIGAATTVIITPVIIPACR